MLQKHLFPALVAGLALTLAGCSGGSANSRIDYKNAVVTKPLEVPPDLTLPRGENKELDLPASAQGAATGSQVLPLQSNVQVAGSGSQRWLVVNSTPEELWPKLKAFWPMVGLTLQRDEPSIGIMETDWAENRADISGGSSLGKVFGKLLSGFHSAPTRDKYHLRLERGDNGTSELYITHYGVAQVVKSMDTEGFTETTWQERPSDPELADEVLKRLMVYLGTPAETAAKLAVTQPAGTNVQLIDDAGPALRLEEGFDRAWRITGIALDRAGLVVEDRDRSNGIYYVSKVAAVETKKNGWFSSLFSGKEKSSENQHLQVKVTTQGDVSEVTLLGGDGKRQTADSARELLERIRDQIQSPGDDAIRPARQRQPR